jgi:Ca2+-binding RTX toxin-like protein
MATFWMSDLLRVGWNMSPDGTFGPLTPGDDAAWQYEMILDTGGTAAWSLSGAGSLYAMSVNYEKSATVILLKDLWLYDSTYDLKSDPVIKVEGWDWIGVLSALGKGEHSYQVVNAQKDHFIGTRWNDTIYSGPMSDIVEGRGGVDRVYAGAGNDVLRGGSQDDILRGGAGSDFLNGGAGADDLYAGPDNARDTFAFRAGDSGTTDLRADIVYGFDRRNAGEFVWDKLDLRAIDADNEMPGDQMLRLVTKFRTVGATAIEGQVRIQDLGADVKLLIDWNGDNSVDGAVKVIGVGGLSAADLWI